MRILAHIFTAIVYVQILAHIPTAIVYVQILAHISTAIVYVQILAHIPTAIVFVQILTHMPTAIVYVQILACLHGWQLARTRRENSCDTRLWAHRAGWHQKLWSRSLFFLNTAMYQIDKHYFILEFNPFACSAVYEHK